MNDVRYLTIYSLIMAYGLVMIANLIPVLHDLLLAIVYLGIGFTLGLLVKFEIKNVLLEWVFRNDSETKKEV